MVAAVKWVMVAFLWSPRMVVGLGSVELLDWISC